MSEIKKKKELDTERHERIAKSLETIADCMELFLKALLDSKDEDDKQV